ncbi:hypothetical protein OSTOST_00179 [Ostertagia ostertagi]
MQQFNVAGVAMAIVKDGKIVYEKGYGVKSIATQLPIASNSKAFTTAALSILIDEGKLNWRDKPVPDPISNRDALPTELRNH